MLNHFTVGAALFLAGIGLRAWGIHYLTTKADLQACYLSFTSLPRERLRVGPYRFLSHPLYVGSSLMIAGVGMAALGWGGVVLAYAAYPHFNQRAKVERQMLDEEFPSA